MKKRIIFLLSLTALIGIGAMALVAARPKKVWPRQESKKPAPALSSAIAPIQSRASDPVQNIRFTLYDEGIKPNEITVQKGLVSVLLEDRTRKSQGLTIERETGNARVAAGQVKRANGFWRGRDQMRLTPGTYRVFEAGKPGNRARLIVMP